MTTLKIHSVESAPAASKALLENVAEQTGIFPNLFGALAESPQLLEAYQALDKLFAATSLSIEEQAVVSQTINVENASHYCVPANTSAAQKSNVDSSLIEALRTGAAMPTEKLQALKDFTQKVVRNRGRVEQYDLNAFYDAGYGEKQVLEIILGVSQRTIGNYVSHIANTPVDEAYAQFEWMPEDAGILV